MQLKNINKKHFLALLFVFLCLFFLKRYNKYKIERKEKIQIQRKSNEYLSNFIFTNLVSKKK